MSTAYDEIVTITPAADFQKRTGAKPIAISTCELRLQSADYISPCIEALIQFERILRQRPDEDIRYEWANVRRRGLLIQFEILWYDRWFFEQRKEAYRVGPHPFAFRRFGATVDDLRIEHAEVG